MATVPLGKAERRSVSPLQIRAWRIANESYSLADGAVYRAYARELYWQALHDHIKEIFAALDAQNAMLDAAMGGTPGENTAGDQESDDSALRGNEGKEVALCSAGDM